VTSGAVGGTEHEIAAAFHRRFHAWRHEGSLYGARTDGERRHGAAEEIVAARRHGHVDGRLRAQVGDDGGDVIVGDRADTDLHEHGQGAVTAHAGAQHARELAVTPCADAVVPTGRDVGRDDRAERQLPALAAPEVGTGQRMEAPRLGIGQVVRRTVRDGVHEVLAARHLGGLSTCPDEGEGDVRVRSAAQQLDQANGDDDRPQQHHCGSGGPTPEPAHA